MPECFPMELSRFRPRLSSTRENRGQQAVPEGADNGVRGDGARAVRREGETARTGEREARSTRCQQRGVQEAERCLGSAAAPPARSALGRLAPRRLPRLLSARARCRKGAPRLRRPRPQPLAAGRPPRGAARGQGPPQVCTARPLARLGGGGERPLRGAAAEDAHATNPNVRWALARCLPHALGWGRTRLIYCGGVAAPEKTSVPWLLPLARA